MTADYPAPNNIVVGYRTISTESVPMPVCGLRPPPMPVCRLRRQPLYAKEPQRVAETERIRQNKPLADYPAPDNIVVGCRTISTESAPIHACRLRRHFFGFVLDKWEEIRYNKGKQ